MSRKNVSRMLRNFFGYSRQEYNAMKIILPLVFLISIYPALKSAYLRNYPPMPIISGLTEDSLNHLLSIHKNLSQPAQTSSTPHLTPENLLDVNSIPARELQQFGFPKRWTENLEKYRSAGGYFQKPEDLFRVWGMDSHELAKRIHWFHWSTVSRKSKGERPQQIFRSKKYRVKRELGPVDLNEVDTLQLQSIRGIGSVLSNRIVKYREKLGGYIAVEQLYEVYYLDSSVVEEMKKYVFIAEGFSPQQLALDTCSIGRLAAHPYLTYKEATVIKNYWKLHKEEINTVFSFLNIPIIDSLKVRRLAPYIFLR